MVEKMNSNSGLAALLVYIEAESLPGTYNRRPQLGLYYLAQYAKEQGYDVKVDTLSSNDLVVQRILRTLHDQSCNILGFYIDQDNIWFLREVIQQIKSKNPRVLIIVGGPQVTTDPVTTMERLPFVLCGVIGEGELTFAELLSIKNLSPENICNCDGLIYRNNQQLITTKERKAINDIDLFPIPRREELTLENDFLPFPSMITGRGCTGNCTFCFEGRKVHNGKRLRLHSLQRCLDEFDYLAKDLKNKYICMLDDTFVADTRRLRSFCNHLIRKYHGEIKWFCEARVDTLARNPDLIPLMMEAGMMRLQVGGESGCQHILDAYKKGIHVEDVVSVVNQAKSSNLLSVYINFIVGGAFETHETYNQTLNFALNLIRMAPGCVSVGKSIFTPYPGTLMYEDPGSFGIEILDDDIVTGFGDRHAFCRTTALSKFEIIALGYEFVAKINKEMKYQSQTFSRELIEKHFSAHYKYGISTEWENVLNEFPPLYLYFNAIYADNKKSLQEIRKLGIEKAVPIRLVELISSMDNKYLLPYRGEILRLDDLDSVILELSSGKLNFTEILEIIQDQFPQAEPEVIKQLLLDKYEYFDNIFSIVWRTTFYDESLNN